MRISGGPAAAAFAVVLFPSQITYPFRICGHVAGLVSCQRLEQLNNGPWPSVSAVNASGVIPRAGSHGQQQCESTVDAREDDEGARQTLYAACRPGMSMLGGAAPGNTSIVTEKQESCADSGAGAGSDGNIFQAWQPSDAIMWQAHGETQARHGTALSRSGTYDYSLGPAHPGLRDDRVEHPGGGGAAHAHGAVERETSPDDPSIAMTPALGTNVGRHRRITVEAVEASKVAHGAPHVLHHLSDVLLAVRSGRAEGAKFPTFANPGLQKYEAERGSTLFQGTRETVTTGTASRYSEPHPGPYTPSIAGGGPGHQGRVAGSPSKTTRPPRRSANTESDTRSRGCSTHTLAALQMHLLNRQAMKRAAPSDGGVARTDPTSVPAAGASATPAKFTRMSAGEDPGDAQQPAGPRLRELWPSQAGHKARRRLLPRGPADEGASGSTISGKQQVPSAVANNAVAFELTRKYKPHPWAPIARARRDKPDLD
ncbi:hypothetical protein BESB_009580 [Besnoitia besnoiti]|uniref:Uncharacterized protein n=1 Tax=Besnoitia besnoiti TaxID=94643 RepID=A0A2A9MQ66_BESBE|nr:hypothetical protein BESB_009580 [Besnoitia besnoiti]PFH38616.1 hypothetical protein BESB_009580 [Besnoitia besnoiti]